VSTDEGGAGDGAASSAQAARADVIVVAAGESRRMAGIDKLTAPVVGRPLLAWTLEALAAADVVERIVLVATPVLVGAVTAVGPLPQKVVAVVDGGPRRQESVAAGIAALDAFDAAAGRPPAPARVVLVHDGARPVISAALVARVADSAARHGASIPVLPVAETLKRIDGLRVVETVDRAPLAAAQTPQGFRRGILAAAYERFDPAGPDSWTDEAALLEACSIGVHVVPGEAANIKVTYPDDLARVAAAIRDHHDIDRSSAPAGGAATTRIGFGEDSHSFGPGGPLMLGGVEIAGAPGLHGHSDGDVALHAVADALLGAAGLGDLGRLFPAGAATPRGIASAQLVRSVVERVADAGWTPVGLDLTIVGARPRLAAALPRVASSIADLLGLPPGRVNAKASTGNLIGPEGAGRAMTARAVAVLAPVGIEGAG
jgi:2-C-methyl-D-erythritol 4-phosphate cytidylyltransferase/2-C-methyl-D-erythritol 2,4-cyclodiphosphate synthase